MHPAFSFLNCAASPAHTLQAFASGGVCMAKYGKSASKNVKSAMRRKKKGTLKSGRSGKRVTSRKQAIAIGLSEAREKGGKVPRKSSRKGARKSSRKRSSKQR